MKTNEISDLILGLVRSMNQIGKMDLKIQMPIYDAINFLFEIQEQKKNEN